MQFKYQAVYRVRGLALSLDDGDMPLFDEEGQIKVTLTRNLSPLIPILERGTALPYLILRGLVGNPVQSEFPENLRMAIAERRAERERQFGQCSFVLIELYGDVEASITDQNRILGDFLLCFEAYDKHALAEQLQPQISTVLCALRMTGGEEYHFDYVLAGSYLIDDTGRIVHSISIDGGRADVFVSRNITAEQVGCIREDLGLLRKDPSLERVVRLHSHSLNRRLDNFRAFHSAWNALEIFVNKVAPSYKAIATQELSDPKIAADRKKELEASLTKLAEKITVSYNFELITGYLGEEGRDVDLASFALLKRARNLVIHGQDFVEDELPTADVHRLFDKYLRNHLRY
jgi:hypothetical protein